jgi:hypothetical protein
MKHLRETAMKVVKRDWIFIAVIVFVLGIILASTMQEKPKKVPYDDKHSRFYNSMNNGGERTEVEKGCAECHGIKQIPLSKSHPPKEHCLLCHKLDQTNKQGLSRP